MDKKVVLVRTYSAGVHFGTLISRNGREVQLTDARRIWSWNGANTLNEIATAGVGRGSRVSRPVSSIVLTEAIELIDCTAEAIKNLENVGWNNG